MKRLTLLLAALVALPALLAFTSPAEAHGRWRGGVSLHFGFPLWHSGYWGPRYYYPHYYPYGYYYSESPTPIYPLVEQQPTYIERDDIEASSTRTDQIWWYWCAGAKRYYPYVKECPSGWQRVPPQAAR